MGESNSGKILSEKQLSSSGQYISCHTRSGYMWSTATPVVVYIQKSHNLLKSVSVFPLVVARTILSQCLSSATFKSSTFLPAKEGPTILGCGCSPISIMTHINYSEMVK